MAAKPIFTEEQFDTLQRTAKKLFRDKFQAHGKGQKEMALALGITQQSVSNLMRGTYRPGLQVATELETLAGIELEDLVGPFAAPSPAATHAATQAPQAGFVNLDVCISFHASSKHWSPWTIAAARAGFFGNADFAPPEWAGKLDLLEKALEKARKTA